MLLRQNSRLRALRIYNWSLPALAAQLPDGRNVKVCPSAGVCASACYARNGTFLWPVVKARHTENLRMVLDEPQLWQEQMLAELAASRFDGAWVRVHDSGDFFSREYLARWLEIMRARPRTRFYCYTKEVKMFREMVEPDPPLNFSWVYSFGGLQDGSLDVDRDRVADVFPDEESIAAAGWSSQAESDLLAVVGPAQVGIPANNIARFRARQAGRRWSDWQAGVEAARRAKAARAAPMEGFSGSSASTVDGIEPSAVLPGRGDPSELARGRADDAGPDSPARGRRHRPTGPHQDAEYPLGGDPS